MRHVQRTVRAALLTGIVAGTIAGAMSCARNVEPEAPMSRGEEAYLAYCSMCHGLQGAGNGPMAGAIAEQGGPRPARLNDADRLASLGRSEVERVIREGGLHTGRSGIMPAWGERIDADVIGDIADHVMEFPSHRTPAAEAALAAFLAAPEGSARDGRRLYVEYCSVCHGAAGKGDGFYADTLWARNRVKPRDLTETAHFAERTDEALYTTIALGGGHGGVSTFMPAWQVTLTSKEMKSLVRYVRAISRTAPSR